MYYLFLKKQQRGLNQIKISIMEIQSSQLTFMIKKAKNRKKKQIFQTFFFKEKFDQKVFIKNSINKQYESLQNNLQQLKLFEQSIKQFEDLFIMNLPLINKEKASSKKLFIVVGKSKHGKTSFINMLKQKDQNFFGNDHISSQQFRIYEMSNTFKQKIKAHSDQKIYLLDTPGFNSSMQMLELIQNIQKLVQKQRFQIVGIFYVLKLRSGREFNEHGKSLYAQLYKTFPIAFKKKELFSSFIFSFNDMLIQYPQQTKDSLNSLCSEFQKTGINVCKRYVKWMSEPSKDLQKFKRKTGQSKELQNQMKQEIDYKISESFNSQDQILTELMSQMMKVRVQCSQVPENFDKLLSQIPQKASQCIENQKNCFGMVNEQFLYNFEIVSNQNQKTKKERQNTIKSNKRYYGIFTILQVLFGIFLYKKSFNLFYSISGLFIVNTLAYLYYLKYKIPKKKVQINEKEGNQFNKDKKQEDTVYRKCHSIIKQNLCQKIRQKCINYNGQTNELIINEDQKYLNYFQLIPKQPSQRKGTHHHIKLSQFGSYKIKFEIKMFTQNFIENLILETAKELFFKR